MFFQKIATLLIFVISVFPAIAFNAPAATSVSASDSVADVGFSERLAVKTNLLYDAGGFPSLAVEFPLSHSGRWSLDISGNYNPISYGKSRLWKHWLIQPELRYNFGHGLWQPRGISFFWATHLLGGQYNLQNTPVIRNVWHELRDSRFQGWGIGLGTGIGVRFNFSSWFAVELEAAAGYVFSHYDRYRCGNCGERLGDGNHNYFGPTKAAVNLVLRIPSGRKPALRRADNPMASAVVRDTVRVERILRDTIFQKETLPGDTIVLSPEIRHSRMTLRLKFRLDDSTIDPELGDNAEQLDSLDRFISRYCNDMTLRVQSVDVEGYSSIEGGAAYNKALSERRAESMARYIARELGQFNLDVRHFGMGEDWESLSFPDKRHIMAIPDLDERQRELQKIDGGRLYESLLRRQIPATRRVECVINFTEIENVEKKTGITPAPED